MRKFVAVLVAALVVVLLTPSVASAEKPIRDSDSFSFSGPDEGATIACGAPISVDVRGNFSLLLRSTKDGGLLVTEHSVFHATFTNMDTGKSAKTNGGNTVHVVVGAGTDGREVVKITGLQGHVVAPGSGSSAQDSGQLVIEAFGPGDEDPIFVSAHGLFEGMGGPFPELCDVLS